MIFFIFSVTSSAQVDDIQKEARNLFSSSDSNIKSLNLTGFKDGGIEIRLYLANKGDEWKGICYYPSSQEKIRMEGGVVEGNLLLDEFDRDDNVFGMWLIDFKNPGYNAKWRNIAGSRTFDIKFYELNYLPENNYAVAKMYSGHLLNDDFEIILMDYHKNKLKGNFINIRQKEYLKNNIECNDQACDSFTVNVKNNKIKKLICNRKENDIISITVFNNTGTQFKSEIAEVNKLKFAN
ncbi:MAG TPA: hypothetical protein ENI82_00615, partial [Bacteroidetes bacterium]|nr:hypothetical protein [Bacteroidota bacterium]